jgi:hypothetical protein
MTLAEAAPIACTLNAAEFRSRRAKLADLNRTALESYRRQTGLQYDENSRREESGRAADAIPNCTLRMREIKRSHFSNPRRFKSPYFRRRTA